MSASIRPLKYLLGWLIAGTRGGLTRAKIIIALKETPQNANQLATSLKTQNNGLVWLGRIKIGRKERDVLKFFLHPTISIWGLMDY